MRSDWQPGWVVCHRATRPVSLSMVSCPLRGRVQGSTCLSCRFLTTSSLERDESGWCEAPDGLPASRPERRPIPIEPTLPAWPLNLPVLVAQRAVRPAEPLPSPAG